MIDSFEGEHRFLSNFHPSPIRFRPLADLDRIVTSPTVEHAFQASKASYPVDFWFVMKQTTPGKAKRAGRKIEIRRNWDRIRVSVMLDLLRLKFSQNADLEKKLLATGDQKLVEGNHWGDTFWGVCDGEGENHLGILLMQVREEIRTGGSA